jgi:hypothetical protein
MRFLLLTLLAVGPILAGEISIDVSGRQWPISPYIYGRNNSLSDQPGDPLTNTQWQFLREAGVKMFRESGGNNSSKYNWRRKLSSHPDWYNNVYSHDWDFVATSIEENLTGTAAIFTLQLLGRAAATNANNFNDWDYNQSQWWEGVSNNWAGGGGPDAGDGNPDLYLMKWPADSVVGILDHWFGQDGMDLDTSRFRYWNMDNEPEIWSGTHDDVMLQQIPVEVYILNYALLAKKTRALFPEIKLVGAVFANEWQWYNWDNKKIVTGGQSYTLLEYFIKRIAELQKSSGVRLLDVLDLHFYPGETLPTQILQLHRVWFDREYQYPGANGVRRAGTGDWDETINEEFVFERCREWLVQYMGPDHGVSFGVTEMGIKETDPNITALWYASTLGEFASQGVEIFTPWDWRSGMWEVLHLYSGYNQEFAISAISDQDSLLSAYASINSAQDSMTIVLVNRDMGQAQSVKVNIQGLDVYQGDYTYLQLNDLPGTETFESAAVNALKQGTISLAGGTFEISLPSLSITSVLLNNINNATAISHRHGDISPEFEVFPNPFNPRTTIHYSIAKVSEIRIDLYDIRGRYIRAISRPVVLQPGSYSQIIEGSELASGIYLLRFTADGYHTDKKIVFLR